MHKVLAILAGILGGFAFNIFSFDRTWGSINLSHWSFILIILSFAIFSYLAKKSKYFDLYIGGIFVHAISLFWVGVSFDTINLGWLGYFASTAIGLVLALCFPLSLWLSNLLTRTFRPITWICIFCLIEWLRSWLGIGLPWNLAGFCATPFLSSARFFGIHGLSLLILFISLIPHLLRIERMIVLCVSFVFFVDHLLTYTRHRYPKVPLSESDGIIRIVQPSIPMNQKWDQNKFNENLEVYKKLSQHAGALDTERSDNIAADYEILSNHVQNSDKQTTVLTNNSPSEHYPGKRQLKLIIWPESAVPLCVHSRADFCEEFLKTIVPKDGYLILGHPRFGYDKKLYVSISSINDQGLVEDHYDKHILVPFGEYVPFKLPVPKMTFGSFPYSSGIDIKPLKFKNFPDATPLICFETAFPWLLRATKDSSWILSITNDAWFGRSKGPLQHLHLAKLRAIEQGKSLIRVSNNGISGLIYPNGRMFWKLWLDIDQKHSMDLHVPKMKSFTLYRTFGNWIFLMLIIFLLGYDQWRLNSQKKRYWLI